MFYRMSKFLSPNFLKLTKVQIKRAFSSGIYGKNIYSKPLIYSGGDFSELVKESSIFVDKSLFIKEIIENGNEVTLITMPRRWGKSLNLDMLKRFLAVQIDEETGSVIPHTQTHNYKLFAGGEVDLGLLSGKTKTLKQLKIAEHKDIIFDYQGQFPVIFIDFKDFLNKIPAFNY